MHGPINIRFTNVPYLCWSAKRKSGCASVYRVSNRFEKASGVSFLQKKNRRKIAVNIFTLIFPPQTVLDVESPRLAQTQLFGFLPVGTLKKPSSIQLQLKINRWQIPFRPPPPPPGIFKRVLQFMLQHVLARTDSGGGKFERLLWIVTRQTINSTRVIKTGHVCYKLFITLVVYNTLYSASIYCWL